MSAATHCGTRVVDLCCGMGGPSVAARELGMRVVAWVDLNPSAMRTFEYLASLGIPVLALQHGGNHVVSDVP